MFDFLLADSTGAVKVFEKIKEYIGVATGVFLSLCIAVVVLFAIYVGFRLAKAEDDGKRKEAKDQLIYSIIGVISIAVIAAMLKVVIPMTTSGLAGRDDASGIDGVSEALQLINQIVPMILDLIATAGVIFAVWVGWKLMSAEDDKKRKDAKAQLIYVFIGIIAVVVISLIASVVLSRL